MNSNRSQIFLYASISGSTPPTTGLDKFSAGHPVERRLNRIERVVAAYRGKIEDRQENAIQVSFSSADAALLGGCEMLHRCAVLPQLSGQPLALRIGIHQSILHQRARDGADNSREVTALLAALDDTILISENLASSLHAELRKLTRPTSLATIDLPVLQVDWRREIPAAAYGGESLWLSDQFPQRKGSGRIFLLRYGLKTLEISTENPSITVGRDPQCDLVMVDDKVSRHHCRIERQEKGVVLIDNSTNGTCIMTDDGAEFLVKKDSFTLRNKGLLFFGRVSNGDRRGGVRFENN